MIPARSRLFALLLLPLTALHAQNAPAPATAAVYPLEAYSAVGSDFAKATRLAQLHWTEEQYNAFLEGVRAAFQGKPVPMSSHAQRLQIDIARKLQEVAADSESARLDFSKPGQLEAYMKEVSKEYALRMSDSGMAYVIMPGGTGFRPGPDDTIVVSYDVTSADQRTELPPLARHNFRCKVSDLPPGLNEGVQMMTPNGRAMFIIPPDLTYGEGEWPAGVDRGQPLIYTVTLNAVVTGK